MDSFEWNKIAGWVLTAAIAVLGLIIVTGKTFEREAPEKPGFNVVAVEEATAAGPAAEAEKPIAFYLASADPAKGEATFKKCGACHNNAKGGAAGIGPNLYGIVGNVHAHMPGFAYSDAMLAKKGQPWSWDELNEWIKSPKTYMPGNKMSFAGISKPEERANVLAYLNQNSDKPLPLPAVPAEPTAGVGGDKPADAAGKAPDVPVADEKAAAAQPQGNIGGEGAPEVTGTAKRDKQ